MAHWLFTGLCQEDKGSNEVVTPTSQQLCQQKLMPPPTAIHNPLQPLKQSLHIS